jgi:hypothetical protein
VVATGIDSSLIRRSPVDSESTLRALARLRDESRRIVERATVTVQAGPAVSEVRAEVAVAIPSEPEQAAPRMPHVDEFALPPQNEVPAEPSAAASSEWRRPATLPPAQSGLYGRAAALRRQGEAGPIQIPAFLRRHGT